MNLFELKSAIERICEEIGGDLKTNIGSHDIKPSITLNIVDPDVDENYELVDVEPRIMSGCECWCGIQINIKRKI